MDTKQLSRQYFDYIKADGKRMVYLLTAKDYETCMSYRKELGWTIRQCFERMTDYHEALEIVLTQDLLDEPSTTDRLAK